MAINLTTLYTRIGKMGGILNSINTYRGTTLPVKTDSLADQFNASDRDTREGLYNAQARWQAGSGSFNSHMRTLARNVMIDMVKDDNPQPNLSLATAILELITQMKASADSVNRSVVGSSVVAASGNIGDGKVVMSTKLKNGLPCENLFAEDVVILITSDNDTGGATIGSEVASASGEYSQSDALHSLWPRGSGSGASLTAVDARRDEVGGSLNYLANGGFENFIANAPDNWAIDIGTAGTSIKKQTGSPYTGAAALEFVDNSGELTQIHQKLGDSTGSDIGLVGLEQYAVNFWARTSGAPASGVLRVALVDAAGTVINDDEATANSFTVTMSTLGGTYTNFNGSFRTPHILPSGFRLQLKMSTALPVASSLYIDHLSMTRMTQLYGQGPSLILCSGATDFILGDKFTVTFTNTAGAFQRLFDRFFAMKSLGLLLPSSVSPTISDSLVA